MTKSNKQSFTLAYPFDFEGAEITTLELRRPTGGDVRRINEKKGSALAISFGLMADLAEVDPKMIDAMDPEDINQINDWLEPILDPKGYAARQASLS